jgi:sec-independent protein translocase protein TatB
MFDVGLSEILLVAIVALLILGPEQIPDAIRFISRFAVRARGIIQTASDELKKQAPLKEIADDIKITSSEIIKQELNK